MQFMTGIERCACARLVLGNNLLRNVVRDTADLDRCVRPCVLDEQAKRLFVERNFGFDDGFLLRESQLVLDGFFELLYRCFEKGLYV
jgi:hypothetical protein